MALKDLADNIITTINLISGRLDKLESNMSRLEEKIDRAIALQKSNIIRLKNGEDITDDFVYHERTYRDLTPTKAFQLYQKKDFNFILLDVSESSFETQSSFPEAIKMTLEDLPKKYQMDLNHFTPILVISEDGTKSILACELLVELGFYNVNNISGGYKFWPAFKQKQQAA